MSESESKVRWLPLESNPEAMNKFLENIGVHGANCTDVFGFEDDLLAFIPKPHYALVLCFPEFETVNAVMRPIYEKLEADGVDVPENVFFMKQKIGNACGTFALLHSVAQNTDKLKIDTKGTFARWFAQAKELGVEERSKSLETCAALAASHDNCATSGETEADPDNVLHHFICYTNVGGRLYEIDSDRSFPRDCGPTSDDTLLRDAGRVCQALMQKLDNISFSAIALTGA
ncbi:ubiquitin carboxyl-terminal hydrolase [Aphelenchoides avenae]|nr:ubiquitin carboxyl-terminal hydrolase [Aphelenchus avenae]